MKLTNEELVSIIQSHRADSLGVEDGELSGERARALDRYHGRPYGNEMEGRSTIVSKDLSEAVDWAMPAIMRIFTQSGAVAEFDPVSAEDEPQAEIETSYVNQVIMQDNPGWIVLHDAIKDTLLLKNGYVKHWWETTEKIEEVQYSGLVLPELQKLMTDLQQDGCEVEVVGQDQREIMTHQGPMPVFDIELKILRKAGKVRIEAVPAEEIRVSRKCRGSLQDSPFVEHVTRKTRSDLIEMGMKRAFVDDLPAYSQSAYNNQSFSRDSVSDESQSNYGTSVNDRSMDEIEYCEAYVRVDWDDDGVAELRRVVTVGNRIPEGREWNEVAPEVCITGFVAKRVPHRHIGESLEDDIGDLAEIKTTLLRQMFDNIYLTNNSQTAVNERVNLTDFMTSLPGGIKRIEGLEPVSGAFQPIVTPSIIGDILPVLGFVDGIKESRTGITKASAGLDPDTLSNVTKGAYMENMNRASQKIEMITRMVAETGVKELVLRVHALLTRHQDKQRIVRMKGKYVPINPQGWRERTDVTVKVGLGTGNSEERQNKLMMISQLQTGLLAPQGMVGPKEAFALFSDVAKTMGFDMPDKFAMSPDSPEFMQKMANPPPNPAIQIEQAKGQVSMQIEQAKINAEMSMAGQQAELQAKVDISRQQAEAQQLALKAQQDAQLEQFKAQLDAQKDAARLQFEQWKTEFEANTRIQLEHIKRGEVIAPDAAGQILDAQGQINNQLAQAIAEMLTQAVQQIRAPRTIVRDANGRAQGLM